MARDWRELNRALRLGIYGFWDRFNPRTSPLVGLFASEVDVEFVPLTKIDEADVILCSVFGGRKPTALGDGLTFQYIGEPKIHVPDMLSWGDYYLSFAPDSADTFYFPHWLYSLCSYDHHQRKLTVATQPRPLAQKTEFCALYASHDNYNTRGPIVDALNDYAEVHCYGKFRNNRSNDGARGDEVNRSIKKLAVLDRYKYSLAIENSCEPYYVTEKLSEALLANTIPIYWGDPNLAESPFNLKRVINVSGYANAGEEALHRVLTLDNDDATYQKMLRLPIFKRDPFPPGRADRLFARILEDKA